MFKVINSPTFSLLFFNVVLGYVYKIKLELMHIDKEVCYYKPLQEVTYNNKSYTIYIDNKKQYIDIYILL